MIIAIFELENFTLKDYDNIVTELKATGGFPQEHRYSHTSFQKEDKWCVVDVWDSAESMMEFGQNRLFPIFGKLGLVPPQPKIYDVHHFAGISREEVISA